MHFLNFRSSALLEDLDDGDITKKGYCKKRLELFKTLLPVSIKSTVDGLIEKNKKTELSDVSDQFNLLIKYVIHEK